MLVPLPVDGFRPAVPSTLADRRERRSTLAQSVRGRDAQAQWYESGFSNDSFFAPETQRDPLAEDTAPPRSASSAAAAAPEAGTPPRTTRPIRRREDFGPIGDAAGHIIGRG